MKRLSAPQSIRREKQTMNYPNRTKETDRTIVELGLGRWATKAVFVSLLSLFFVYPIPQNAAAQSVGFAFLEFAPFEQTEAAPGQYIILASHPVDGVCGTPDPRNPMLVRSKHQSRAAKAVSSACGAAVRSGGFVGVLCGGIKNPSKPQIDLATPKAEHFLKVCNCDNYCPHLPGQ